MDQRTDRLVLDNLGLIGAMANKLNLVPSLIEGAVAEGTIALVLASQRFIPGRIGKSGLPVKFSTFACTYIRGYMLTFLKRQKHAARLKSFPWADMEDGAAEQIDPPERLRASTADVLSDMEQVAALLSSLSPRVRKIVRLRYGIGGPPHTLQEVGEIVGVTRERVRQIVLAARRSMRRVGRLQEWLTAVDVSSPAR